jgi:hypothetical protein
LLSAVELVLDDDELVGYSEESVALMDADADGRISESEYVATMVVKLGYVSQDKVEWLRYQ